MWFGFKHLLPIILLIICSLCSDGTCNFPIVVIVPIFSFIDVYISLNESDVIIPDHGFVMISDIGSTENTALICNTNRPVINIFNKRHSGGDWYGPSGTRVGGMGSDDVPGFVRTRGPMVVRLLRNTATDPPSEGIYHCVVEDDTMTEHTLYVGLYNSENSKLIIICMCVCETLLHALFDRIYCNT